MPVFQLSVFLEGLGVFLFVDASKAMETNSVFLRQAASKKLVLC